MITGGALPLSTYGTIPIPTSTTIPIVTGGILPNSTSISLPLQANGIIPTTIAHHHPRVTNANFPTVLAGGMMPMPIYMQQPSAGMQLLPQAFPTNPPEVPRNSGFSLVQAHPSYNSTQIHSEARIDRPGIERASQKIAPISLSGKSRSSNEVSSGNSDEGKEAQIPSEIYIDQTNSPFASKPTITLQQKPQGSWSEVSVSNNNSSSSVSSTESTGPRHHHILAQKATNAVQVNNSHQMSNHYDINGIGRNGWIPATNGHIQGSTMNVPISQPFIPKTTVMNEQPQISYYLVLPQWQNGFQSHGPTYQTNSYIYNNSTTLTNYHNNYIIQPGVPNPILTGLPTYRLETNTGRGPEIQPAFENLDKQSSLQRVVSSRSDPNKNP